VAGYRAYRGRDYEFGRRLLALRTACALTQSQLAELLGVSRKAVGAWEGGASYPSAPHLRHLIELCLPARPSTKARRPGLQVFAGHAASTWGVALSDDGHLVADAAQDGTVHMWDTESGAQLRTIRPDRLYERMDMAGLTGITEAQRGALLAPGAVEGKEV